uniref:Ig-like domain-containing protein n=1 Tax=Oryzias latipes TaxID=8090 RepID=A0A3P9JKV5_ORYLA
MSHVIVFLLFSIFLLTPNLPCVSDGDLLSVNIGDEVTLPCSFGSGGKRLSWYQQRVGQHPQIISSMYKHSYSKSFNKEFTDRRFSVHTEGGFYSLNISDVQKSDSAMYYCGHTSIAVTEFDRGTFLMSILAFLLHKPDWDSAPGGSVTLNCTLLTGTSDGEGRVYWFLQESGGFSWGSMKMQSGSSSEGASGSESAEHSCDFTSPQRGVGPSEGGTSLCAVAACGQILLGTGMRRHVGALLCFCSLLTLKSASEGLQHQSEVPADSQVSSLPPVLLNGHVCGRRVCNADLWFSHQDQDSSAVQYAALDFKQRRETSLTQTTIEESVYSAVRRSH